MTVFAPLIWETRPYTRAKVACGWAGAAKKLSVTDRQTDRTTDRRTDGQTDRAGHRVACTRLKKLPGAIDQNMIDDENKKNKRLLK